MQTDALIRPDQRITFGKRSSFTQELHQRVNDYFANTPRCRKDSPALYLKTAIIVAWIVGGWAALLLSPPLLWVKLMGCGLMGLGIAAYAMNVFHDASHGSYSHHAKLNAILRMGGDFIGISSYFWSIRHNKLHHVYTNIPGYDMEAHGDGIIRMLPSHEYRWYNRYQHFFIWLIYPIVPIYWFFSEIKLFINACQGSAAYEDIHIPVPKVQEILVFVIARILGLCFFVGLPLMLGYSLLETIVGLTLIYMTYGLVAVQVFMLAHILEKVDFPTLAQNDRRLDEDWFLFQIRTTADFAHRNPILCWYLGGLNYQVVHHLFPNICHIHYPELADILDETCAKYGVNYRRYGTLWDAIVSCYRWLKQMAQDPVTAS
ncbi:MAG: fatty acid desaturase family protein [Prochlorotrichaceae cyanobacterium]